MSKIIYPNQNPNHSDFSFLLVDEPIVLKNGGHFFTESLSENLVVSCPTSQGNYFYWQNYSTKTIFLAGFSSVNSTTTIAENKSIYITPGQFLEGFVNQNGNFKVLSGSYGVSWVPGTAPADPYFDQIALYIKGEQSISDETGKQSITVYGNTSLSSAFSKYASSSILFDGNGDYLSVANSADLSFGASNFTLEAWVYLLGYPSNNAGSYVSTLFAKDRNFSRSYSLGFAGTAGSFTGLQYTSFVNGTPYGHTATFPFNLQTWYHVAVSIVNGILYMFVNGNLIASFPHPYSISTVAADLHIGANNYDSSYTYYLKAHVNHARVTNAGRYFESFDTVADTYYD